jgi:hypothetical protein
MQFLASSSYEDINFIVFVYNAANGNELGNLKHRVMCVKEVYKEKLTWLYNTSYLLI